MPWYSSLLDPATLFGAGGGGGLLGFLAGHVKTRNGRIAALEEEVEECRKRDARLIVVEAGFRMIVGEMCRKDPKNQVLKLCGDLLNRELGPAPSDFEDLIHKLDEVAPDYEPPFRAPKP